jgi:hypothetical protein
MACSAAFPLEALTALDRRTEQTFELGINGRGGVFVYRLIVEHNRAARKNRITYEDLCFDGKGLYQFQNGEAHLFRDDGTAGPHFPFDWSRSAIATIPERKDNALLSWFRERLNRLFIFAPDPLRIISQSDEEQPHPDRWLHQLASWIRHLHLEFPEVSQRLAESLRQDVLDGFTGYRFLDQGEGSRALKIEFGPPPLDVAEFAKNFSWGGTCGRITSASASAHTSDPTEGTSNGDLLWWAPFTAS